MRNAPKPQIPLVVHNAKKARRSERQRQKSTIKRWKESLYFVLPMCAVIIVVLMSVTIQFASRLPYLRTSTLSLTWFVLMALVFVGLVLAMSHRHAGRTSIWKRWYGTLNGRGRTAGAVRVGIYGFAIAAALAWTGVSLITWSTYRYASHAYRAIDEVSSVTKRSRRQARYDLQMASGATLRLRTSFYFEGAWQAGERLCLVGRTWWLGTVIDEIHRDLSQCGSNVPMPMSGGIQSRLLIPWGSLPNSFCSDLVGRNEIAPHAVRRLPAHYANARKGTLRWPSFFGHVN